MRRASSSPHVRVFEPPCRWHSGWLMPTLTSVRSGRDEQERRVLRGEISKERVKKIRSVVNAQLSVYVGTTQVHLIGQETWDNYRAWRRETGTGRFRDKIISDSTIRFEMSIFGAAMNYAAKKKYITASQRFEAKPKLKTMRRDEFSLEEYRKLHTVGRSWVAKATKPSSIWYRTIAYNIVLVMCNTGMRPSEAKNLRWRDVMVAKDHDGREIAILFVQGTSRAER